MIFGMCDSFEAGAAVTEGGGTRARDPYFCKGRAMVVGITLRRNQREQPMLQNERRGERELTKCQMGSQLPFAATLARRVTPHNLAKIFRFCGFALGWITINQ
jgi:hypothetical protein